MILVSDLVAIKDDPYKTQSQKVREMFKRGTPCSWIDDFMELPPGTAKRLVLEWWTFE